MVNVSLGKTERKKGTPTYVLVARDLKQFIVDQHLRIGDSLPTERELSKTLAVSRHSLREALRLLQEKGILASQQGSGNHIASTNFDLLEENILGAHNLPQSERDTKIFEFRKMLEPQIAGLAATMVTDAELDQMAALLEQQKQERNTRTLSLLDDQFHLAIAAATQNHIVLNVIKTVNSLISPVRSELYQSPLRKALSVKGHEEILAALRSREPDAARRAMLQHVMEIRDLVVRPDE